MKREDLDVMWSIATKKSIEDNEPFTRYEFAKMVAAIECEACAEMVDHICKEGGGTYGDAIRARGEA